MQLPITFLNLGLLALIVAVAPLLWLRRKRQTALGHSHVGIHNNLRAISLVGRAPTILFVLLVLVLAALLARPVLPFAKETRSIETRDILVAVDISGSMGSALPTQPPASAPTNAAGTQTSDTTTPQTYRRLDAAKDAVAQFVDARPKDRIGLLEFDDETYWLWPLSDDHKIVRRKADSMNSYLGGGTNFEGPSDSNPRMGPIQAAINHFKKYGKAKSKILIMVTDGEDSISEKRMAELAAQLNEAGIKLYVLGVGEGWTNGSTPDLQKLAEAVGGQVFRVGDSGAMQSAFDTINKTEVSRVQLERSVAYKDLYSMGCALLLVLIVLYLGSTALVRRDA